MNSILKPLFITLAVLCMAVPALAQDGGRPPSPVVVSKVTKGDMAPQSEFIGTVYFTEISNVASEVTGKVVDIKVTDGQRVSKGDVMVVLSSSLLEKTIRNARALALQAKADFESAQLEHERVSALFKTRSVAEGEFDSKRLTADALQYQYEARQATLAQLQEEAEKKRIRAPYDGVVIDVKANRGEWMSVGSVVVVTARDDEYEVVVNAPKEAFGVVKPGLKVGVKVSGGELPGEVFAVVPKGDVATRTFPVKIRVDNNGSLAEGMEARVSLPRGLGGETMIVSRDAVISAQGQQVVWAVLDGKATPIPVYVVGFRGLFAGVKSEKLQEGMDIVVKGNERLRPGQPVAAQPQNDKIQQGS
ncbi:efflux RND transporter periplasmic adaptor subunit [Pseudodesulfovibrio piezophilus]|uniref:Efflux transporter, RND family, MFP subunit n=1 Tax=Pseudodesulfovibrio piezophilus (strain DSM 21447 / JCM 15486 / C1TLV30) TaxID=1322246 RepID=M1WJQ1_PSEP2|nr:efflux RND transporter periplasmic adaptor subunit [Pseudodesulfovibrio piezophilus]CCH48286.1 Efflux transporter, RND family, MFP subunit [Pseudodesulfovibrio piezophilus C1TLV30]